MVDLQRAYRRWLVRHLAVLIPSFLVALSVDVWIAAENGVASWLRVASAAIAVLVSAVLGYFVAQTALCARLQRLDERRAARILRGLLVPYRGVVVASVLLLAAVVAVPGLFHEKPQAPVAEIAWMGRPAPPEPLRETLKQVPPASAVESPALAAAEPAAPPSAPAPQIAGFLDPGPMNLVLYESDFDLARNASWLPFSDVVERAIVGDGDGEEAGLPWFRLQQEHPLEPSPLSTGPEGLDRLGMPREDQPGVIPPMELKLDAIYFSNEDGSAASLVLDCPVAHEESVRLTYLFAILADEGQVFSDHVDGHWQHAALEYVRRLAGYSRHSPFDLAFGAGLGLDSHAVPEAGPANDGIVVPSPYVSIDAAWWQAGTYGLLVHVGQTIPVNLTGTEATVTDLSATLRVDLTEHLSLHAGYRVLMVRFREDRDNVAAGPTRDVLDESLSGPLIGLDLRF